MDTITNIQPANGDKVIMDPIHGAVHLHDHEIATIDHPLFQRLRHVCQNDMLFLVFPGATHTRFAHSIGVMHMASRIFDELVNAHLNSRNKNGLPVISAEQQTALHYLKQCLRLAALLHDTGHGSFSHQLESVKEVQALRSTPQLWDALWHGAPRDNYYTSRPSEVLHEHYSVRAAFEILNDTDLPKSGIFIEDVLGIMETTNCCTSKRFSLAADFAWEVFAGSENARPACDKAISGHIQGLLQQIISGEFDADKSDYMLRDSQYSSVSYGLYNVDNLLNNLRAYWDPADNWLGLCVQHKGVPALEDFIYSRFQLYNNVYNHKTAVGMDLQLHNAISEVLTEDATADTVREMLFCIGDFEYLTDSFFWERFREFAKKQPDSFCDNLLKRKKLRHVGRETNLAPFRINQNVQKIAAQIGCEESEILHITNRARFSKVNDHFTDLRVLAKDPVTKTTCLRTISEVSDFFSKFNDVEITNFYLMPKDNI